MRRHHMEARSVYVRCVLAEPFSPPKEISPGAMTSRGRFLRLRACGDAFALPLTLIRMGPNMSATAVRIARSSLLLGLTWACERQSPPTPGTLPARCSHPDGPCGARGAQAQGFVPDTAFRPVGGVRVEVVDGPTAGNRWPSAAWTAGSARLFPWTANSPSERRGGLPRRLPHVFDVYDSLRDLLPGLCLSHLHCRAIGLRARRVYGHSGSPVLRDSGRSENAVFPATVTARPDTPPGTAFVVTIDDVRFNTPFNFKKFEFGVAGLAIGVRGDVDLWWEAPSLRSRYADHGRTRGSCPAGQSATFSTRVLTAPTAS